MKKFWQKLAVVGAVMLATLAVLATNSVLAGEPVYADDGCEPTLGFVPWSCHVDLRPDSTDDLGNDIWLIAANVAVDLTVAASYLVLGYVIYGGYLYICSNGDPGKVATGKKALTQAFIGLAIVLLASVILNAIRTGLAGGINMTDNCADFRVAEGQDPLENCSDGTDIIGHAVGWVIGIAGAVAAIFVVCGAIAYITSAGDPSKVQQAKKTILYALIGLAIVGLAQVITSFVFSRIEEANTTTTSLIQDKGVA